MLDAIQKVQMAMTMADGGRGKNEAASIAIFGQARQARESESSKTTKRRALHSHVSLGTGTRTWYGGP